MPQELQSRIDGLKDRQLSSHFDVRFNHRNSKRLAGGTAGNVCGRTLISFYVDALERLYRTMTGPHFDRRELVSNGAKIPVHVLDLSEFQGYPHTRIMGGEPVIFLPNRTDEPTLHGEYQYAATSAVHEATHVFNHALRPIGESETWQWFDEATAVFMESWVLPGNHDYLRLSRKWNDAPEVALDDDRHWYAASAFVAYLAKSETPQFLTTIWQQSQPELSALDAIEISLNRRGKKLFSDKPAEIDTLFSQYCLDSYFLWDTAGLGFLPDLYARYGERAITDSFHVGHRARINQKGYRLDHLACRYFLLQLADGVTEVKAKVVTASRDGRTYLKASLAAVHEDVSRGPMWPLRPTNSVTGSGPVILSTGPISLDPSTLDHLVLVVSNCGYRSQRILPRPPLNNIAFDLEIEAS